MIDLDHLRDSGGKQVRVRPQFHAELQRLGEELSGTSGEMVDILREVEEASKVRIAGRKMLRNCKPYHDEPGPRSDPLGDLENTLPVEVLASCCVFFCQESFAFISHRRNVLRQAPAGRIKLEFNAVHSNHLRVTKKDQALVGKCKAALTLSVQKVRDKFGDR